MRNPSEVLQQAHLLGTHKELGALVAEQGQVKDPLREGRVAPLIHLQIILESFQIHSSTLQPHG